MYSLIVAVVVLMIDGLKSKQIAITHDNYGQMLSKLGSSYLARLNNKTAVLSGILKYLSAKTTQKQHFWKIFKIRNEIWKSILKAIVLKTGSFSEVLTSQFIIYGEIEEYLASPLSSSSDFCRASHSAGSLALGGYLSIILPSTVEPLFKKANQHYISNEDMYYS